MITNKNAKTENEKIVSENGGFGFLFSTMRNHINRNNNRRKKILGEESFEEIPFYVSILAYFGFQLLIFLGYLNQFLFPPNITKEKNREGYPILLDKYQIFYFNYLYRRIRDGWEKPICGVPGTTVMIRDRVSNDKGWTFEYTGNETQYLNLGSYNYLGFAQTDGVCSQDSARALDTYGFATASTRKELGTNTLHRDLEKLTAKFLGVEDAITFGMGFATNALNIASLVSSECLVLSDEKNHASLILGLKLAGAVTRIYKHNDMMSLENNLANGLRQGQPNGKPWKKIFIVTEGIFSMEGSIVKLPPLLAIKEKYKAYLYLDEAHSIGAIGPNGRGVTDYYGCDPKRVDILMGTFTKSFGSSGGYIAGSKALIDHIRKYSDAEYYASSMAPPVTQQIISSMKIIMGEDGTDDGKKRIQKLARNTHFFRRHLEKMGVIIYGNDDSPVVPMLVYMFSKLTAVVRIYADHQIAIVGVGFPATPLKECRIRFCLSAGHSLKQLRRVLEVTEKIVDVAGLRYSNRIPRQNFEIYEETDSE